MLSDEEGVCRKSAGVEICDPEADDLELDVIEQENRGVAGGHVELKRRKGKGERQEVKNVLK